MVLGQALILVRAVLRAAYRVPVGRVLRCSRFSTRSRRSTVASGRRTRSTGPTCGGGCPGSRPGKGHSPTESSSDSSADRLGGGSASSRPTSAACARLFGAGGSHQSRKSPSGCLDPRVATPDERCERPAHIEHHAIHRRKAGDCLVSLSLSSRRRAGSRRRSGSWHISRDNAHPFQEAPEHGLRFTARSVMACRVGQCWPVLIVWRSCPKTARHSARPGTTIGHGPRC